MRLVKERFRANPLSNMYNKRDMQLDPHFVYINWRETLCIGEWLADSVTILKPRCINSQATAEKMKIGIGLTFMVISRVNTLVKK